MCFFAFHVHWFRWVVYTHTLCLKVVVLLINSDWHCFRNERIIQEVHLCVTVWNHRIQQSLWIVLLVLPCHLDCLEPLHSAKPVDRSTRPTLPSYKTVIRESFFRICSNIVCLINSTQTIRWDFMESSLRLCVFHRHGYCIRYVLV
jgi:hypothetical protein